MYEIGSREYEMYKIREEKSDKSCKERVTDFLCRRSIANSLYINAAMLPPSYRLALAYKYVPPQHPAQPA